MSEERLPLSVISPNPDQPRKLFKQGPLQELADSIEEHGLKQAIVVTKRDGGWQIVCGERRWRACGMTKRYADKPVPVVKTEISHKDQKFVAIIENLQREDMTQIEEANAFQDLINDGMTVEEVAKKLGIRQSWRITERTSLLNLLPEFQDALTKEIITPSQAFEMSRLEPEDQRWLFKKIGDGKAGDYTKLRALASARIAAKQQPSFFAPPDPKQQEVRAKYDKMLESVLGLVNKSFDQEDLSVLKVALQGNVSLNIERIELIIKHLNKIKKALVENQATQQALGKEVA
jgi:ParB/RepB/Spo0J family partition protein